MRGRRVTTREHLLGIMKEIGRSGAEEIADFLGCDRTTAWRKLEGLAGSGDLTVEMVQGSVGRPAKIYVYGDGSPEQGVPA